MRRVTSLDVSCPSCGANVGETCHELTPVRPASLASAAKHQATSPHEPRRRRAREENARLNPEHVQGQLGLFPEKDARGPVVFICSRGRRGRA